MRVRTGMPQDWAEIARIQRAVPEAAQWEPDGYRLYVAECEGRMAGFLVWRETAPEEAEILNLAVAPEFRRRGLALAMIRAMAMREVFLEVRESNAAARALYRRAGFREAGIRFGYYSHPAESAIVMRLQS
ncbi:MAG: ribosomal protein S18-alanine N-acetyltransferase [Acidobacteriota bacterium]|nr:ribosomal protein S18-alanine N-acetyltransferase [Acidobacteriota bacterium]